MAFEDRVITKFEANIDDLKAKLQQISGLVGKTAGGMQNLGGPVVQRNLQQTSRVTQQFGRSLQSTGREISNTSMLMKDIQTQTGAATTSFRRAAMSIQTNVPALDLLSLRLDRASMMMWKFTMAGISVKELGVITGVTAAGMGLMLKKMVDSFSIIDRVERQFGSIYKSAELGNGAVAFLTDAAAKIRYSITEVLDSGRLLAMEGFAPKDLVYDMADLAAGVNQEGITIVNATRAFVDATNGQFRRLKETFQITREDAMKFAPDAFSGPNNQISNQAKATEAIIKAIRAKYQGMNEATMQTIQGQLSNVDDAIINAVSPMGEALKPVLMGWFSELFKVLGKIEEFGKTGLGGAVAKTLLFTAVSLGAVSALSMFAASLTSLLGIFAAYKVFVGTREKGVMNILKAEVELMAVEKKIAEFEAMRNSQDVEALKMKLALSKAVYNEEQKRLSLAGVPLPGGDKNPLSNKSLEELTATRRQAQANVDMIAKPRELLGITDNLASIQEEIQAIEGTTLGVESERYKMLKAQEVALLRQEALMKAQIEDARAIAAGGAGVATQRVMAQQAQEDADALAAIAAQEEAAATSLQAEADKLATDVGNLKTRQTELAAVATDLETAAVEANTAATLANADAKAASFRFSEKQKVVSTLASSRDVELYALDTQIKEKQLEVMSKKQGKKESDDDFSLRQLHRDRLAAEVEQRHLKLPELESQAAIRTQTEAELGDLEKEMQLKKSVAEATAVDRRAAAAAARENKQGLREVNSELSKQEKQLEKVNTKLAKQRQIAGSAQAEAAAAQGRVGGVGTGGTEAVRTQANLRNRIFTLRKAEIEYMQRANDLNNADMVRDQGRLVQIRERLALRERELLIAEGTAAADTADAAAQRAGLMAGRGALGTRIGGAFGSGADAMIKTLLGPLTGLVKMITGIEMSFATFGSTLASLAGAFVVLLPLVVGIGGALYVFDYAKKVQKDFTDSIKESIDALKTWDGLLKPDMSEQLVKEKFSSALDVLMKVRDTITNADIAVGRQIMEQEGMTFEKARETIAMLEEQASLNRGATAEQAAANADKIRSMSPEQLRNVFYDPKDFNYGMSALASKLDETNAKTVKQGMLLDENAKKWLDQQIASGKLTAEQAKQYEELKKSEHPAKAVANMLKDQYEAASNAVPEMKNIQDAMEAGLEAGKDDAEIQAELVYTRDEANQKLKEMTKSLEDQRALGLEVNRDDQKRVDQLAQQLKFLENIEATYKAIVSLRESGKSEGLLSSAGMSNTGYIFGGDNARDSWTAAMGEKDPKKRQQLMEDAFKAQLSAVEGATAVDLSNTEVGPWATPEEKAASSSQKAAIYRRDFQRKRDEVMNPAISHLQKRADDAKAAGDTKKAAELEGQAARAKEVRDMMGRESERKAQAEDAKAYDTLVDSQVKKMGAKRDLAAVNGASARTLAGMDMNILQVKMKQAKVHRDIAEQMNLQVQAAQVLKGLAESALSDEEAKLSFMQTQADQGIIPQEAVDGEKRRLAQMYTDRANAAAKGSAEYYSNMQKALQLLGDDTAQEWDGIVGKILGAPAELLNNIVSEGGMAKRFGNMDMFGLSGKMQAEIVSQSNRELLVRVNFDSALSTVDSRIRAALPVAINVMGQQLVGALSN